MKDLSISRKIHCEVFQRLLFDFKSPTNKQRMAGGWQCLKIEISEGKAVWQKQYF